MIKDFSIAKQKGFRITISKRCVEGCRKVNLTVCNAFKDIVVLETFKVVKAKRRHYKFEMAFDLILLDQTKD